MYLRDINNPEKIADMQNSSSNNTISTAQENTAKQITENDSISILNILLFITKSMKLLIGIPFVICVLAIVYVLFIAQPAFESSSTILPSGGSDPLSGMRGLATQFGVSLPEGSGQTNLLSSEMYREIIESRTLSEILLSNKFFTEKYGEEETLLSILAKEFSSDIEDSIAVKEMAIDYLITEMIGVRIDNKSDLITITIESFEPKLAHDINSRLLLELDLLQKKFRLESTNEKLVFIEGRAAEIERQLESAEEALKNFRDQNRQIVNSPSLLIQEERLKREVQVQIGVFTSIKQQLEFAKIEAVEKSSLVQVLDQPNIMMRPTKPNKAVFVFLSGIIGIFLGLVVASLQHLYHLFDDGQQLKVELIKQSLRFWKN